MSLGLLTGYGSGSESDNEEESQTAPGGDNTQGAGPLADRLRVLSDGGGVGLALTLPPPPPPEPEPLPNPMKTSKPKQKSIPGMSKKEMELLKNAKWMDITTEGAVEGGGEEFEYNTPLPFSKDKQPRAGGEGSSSSGAEPVAAASSAQPEYDYVSYVAEYQNYLAHSAALMQGQERARQLAEQAAEGGEQPGVPGEGGDEAGAGSGGQVWDEYMTKYAAWYAQYGAGAGAGGAPQQPVQPQLRQKTFEELLEQDRQLDNYFSSEPPNEYNTQRDAFKSSFRGTRRYRMLNGGNYNAKHFNTLSSGAKKFAEMYPKQKSVIEDKDAYVADKDLPENQDIKSNKQRKKDKWFQGMVEKKKGCKKCGFVFCRCYGWEFKPSHVK